MNKLILALMFLTACASPQTVTKTDANGTEVTHYYREDGSLLGVITKGPIKRGVK